MSLRKRPRSPKQMARRTQWIITALVVALTAGIYLNATLFDARIDLTPEGRFSLSDATLELLSDFDDPVRIRYYVSERLRSLSDEPQRTEQLLTQFDVRGGRNVEVEIIDASGATAEQAREAGLRGESIQEGGSDSVSVTTVFSGITIDYLDRSRTIPFLFGHDQLEYQLSNALWDILQHDRPRIAVTLGSGEETFDMDYGQLREELSDRFTFEVVAPGDSVPSDAAALLLLGSRDLSEPHALAIREFLEGGGSAFMALDGTRIDLSTFEASTLASPVRSSVELLLSGSGIAVEPVVLLDDRNNPLELDEGPVADYPPWIATDARNADPQHPVTRFTAGLDLFWASPLRLDTPARGSVEPLIVSSPASWLQTEPFDLTPGNRAAMERDRSASQASYALAAWSEHVASDGSRTIVVADSDFASNLMFYTESFENLQFVERSIMWLLGEDGVAGLHAEARTPSALDRIEEPFARAITARIIEVVNVIVIPLSLLLWSMLRLRRRRRSDEGTQS